MNHIRNTRPNHPIGRATRPSNPRRQLMIGVLVAFATLTVGCGEETDTVSSDACDRYAELQAGFFGDPAQLGTAAEAFAAAAPEALADDVDVLVEAFGSDNPDAMGSPEFAEASERVGDAIFSGCETAASVDVDGVDYAFAGLPESIDAGRLALRLQNVSATEQPHEVVIVTGTDGQSADELRVLPMDELMQQARPVGLAFVDTPGTSATTLVDLEPGSYLLICSLPVAEGGELPEGDGPPTDTHAAHGMVATLTVV